MNDPATRNCPECGAAVPPGANVCEMCAAVIGEHGSEAPQDVLDDRKTAGNAAMIAIGCLAILVIVGLVGWLLA